MNSKVFNLIFFTLFTNQVYSQLEYLPSKNFKYVDSIGDIYETYRFAVILEDGKYCIKDVNASTYLFKPDKEVYYEVFNNKYLLASYIDSMIIKKHLSTMYFYFPRNLLYIIPINKNFNETYIADLKGKLVYESIAPIAGDTSTFYFISNIDTKSLSIKLVNYKTKKTEIVKMKKMGDKLNPKLE